MTCRGPECDRPTAALGLCTAHHQQHARQRPLTPLRARRSGSAVDRALDALWCLGRPATVTEIAERARDQREATAQAIHRHSDLFEAAGGVELPMANGRVRTVPTFRLSEAGLDRLNGSDDHADLESHMEASNG